MQDDDEFSAEGTVSGRKSTRSPLNVSHRSRTVSSRSLAWLAIERNAFFQPRSFFIRHRKIGRAPHGDAGAQSLDVQTSA